MTFLQALRNVRPLIASCQYAYICFALDRVGASQFKRRVESQLGGYATYESWLISRHPKVWRRMNNLQTYHRDPFREGRLQWIDHMIAIEQGKKP